MENIKEEMRFLRNQLVVLKGAVDRLDVMGVKVILSVLLPEGKRDGCQGTTLTLNEHLLIVTGKFEKEL